eukprot:TRINITY_DN10261_c0_g1_i1.p1 TRINITY_DN10261_c0_g1~~TRINITY_DN10261_c0_g1_i1.p1  ORF type:complete len:290 (+),score=59.11 TRINITY_DN10261_c0_g1_i1:85-954(+)
MQSSGSLDVGAWQSWGGRDVAQFLTLCCGLPQYAATAERNLSGRRLAELDAAGCLRSGLIRAGIADFDHLRLVAAALRGLRRDAAGLGGGRDGSCCDSPGAAAQPVRARGGDDVGVVGEAIFDTAPPTSPMAPAARTATAPPRTLLQQARPDAAALPSAEEWAKRRRKQAVAGELAALGKPAPLKSLSCSRLPPVRRQQITTAIRSVGSDYRMQLRETPTQRELQRSISSGALVEPFSMTDRATAKPWADVDSNIHGGAFACARSRWRQLRVTTARCAVPPPKLAHYLW